MQSNIFSWSNVRIVARYVQMRVWNFPVSSLPMTAIAVNRGGVFSPPCILSMRIGNSPSMVAESPRDDSPRENVPLYDVRYCIKIRMIKSTG